MPVLSSQSHLHSPHGLRVARSRRLVATIEAVVGIGAVFGGYGLLSDAERLGAKRQWLDGSVFPDFTVPGLVLLVVIGGGMLCAAAITTLKARYATMAAGLMAALLLGWGVTESITIGWRGWQQLALVGAFVAAPVLILGSYSLRGRHGR